MNEREDEAPFPREPWRRLLGESTDGPAETTDARIRAAARRDLAPRGHRWWLPASLAASFVLAIFIVQSQFGTIRVPVKTESDRGAGGAINAHIVDRENAQAARPPGQAPGAPGERPAQSREEAEPDEYGYPDFEMGADSAGTGPRIGGPERDVQAASELPDDFAETGPPPASLDLPPPPAIPAAAAAAAEEKKLGEVDATGRIERREAESPTPVDSQLAMTRIQPAPFQKTPETWYAYIEKLRAQGRTEEADRQLARLQKAHPGWLEQHLAKQPPR